MAWSVPANVSAGGQIQAATTNAILGDLAIIGGAWTSFTPTWTGTGTNPVLGNGTMVGRSVSAGKLTIFSVRVTMGSTTTYGSGSWQFAPPSSPAQSIDFLFSGVAYQLSTTSPYPIYPQVTSTPLITIQALPTTAGNPLRGVTSAVPFAWATGDTLTFSGMYEAA